MYTDVDPDSVVVAPEVESAAIFEIDMNSDGTTDVTIVAGNGDWYYDTSTPKHWYSIRALPGDGAEVPLQSSVVTATGWGTYWFAMRFDAGDLIGSDIGTSNYWSGPLVNTSGTWSWQLGFDGTSYSTYYNYGLWNDGETDKYLGIRFSLDEGVTYHYGWVRLDVPEDHKQVTVKDYAYEATADVAIEAGKKWTTSIRDGLENDLGVKIFSHQNKIIISDLELDHATADVFNVTGQLVRSVQVEAGRNEVPMNDKGLYIVRIDMGGEMVSSKVIVQ